jgi:hypothetical protein
MYGGIGAQSDVRQTWRTAWALSLKSKGRHSEAYRAFQSEVAKDRREAYFTMTYTPPRLVRETLGMLGVEYHFLRRRWNFPGIEV